MDKIDEAANNWNKTKDPKYKYLWYKLIKEWYGRAGALYAHNYSNSRRGIHTKTSKNFCKSHDTDGMF
tara:strand:- start:473 stop:676 length:204 start_codon:yes stop_codon:yes gene_type:complete